MQHIIEAGDFTTEEIDDLCERAGQFHKNAVYRHLEGFVLASLFMEPSTRTRLSTEAAMLRLGGRVITVDGEKNTSKQKGESLCDTLATVSQYADVIALRTSEKLALQHIKACTVPLINCGDGSHAHPTQMLTDIMRWQALVQALACQRLGALCRASSLVAAWE